MENFVCLNGKEPINCPIFDIQKNGCYSCNIYVNKMEDKINKLIDGVLETSLTFLDSSSAGHFYTCPFCSDYKEVKANESVDIGELNHSDDCTYILALELYRLRS